MKRGAVLENMLDSGLPANPVGSDSIHNGMTFYGNVLSRAVTVYSMTSAFSAEEKSVFFEVANKITPFD